MKKSYFSSFLGHLGRDWLLQDEAEYLFPSHWLAEAHCSGWGVQTSYLLWEAFSHRSCCWCSGWRMEGGVVQICGKNNKQGFPIKQGFLIRGHVCLLLCKGHSCYRLRRSRERKCKSVLWMLMPVFFTWSLWKNQREKNIVPHGLEPKRLSRLCELFNQSL